MTTTLPEDAVTYIKSHAEEVRGILEGVQSATLHAVEQRKRGDDADGGLDEAAFREAMQEVTKTAESRNSVLLRESSAKVEGVVKKNPASRQAILKAWTSTTNFFSDIWGKVVDFVRKLSNAFFEFVNQVGSIFKAWFSEIEQWFAQAHF